MSLAHLAPDAEHDLRLPQLAPLAQSTPPEARVEARAEAHVNAPLYHVDAGGEDLLSIAEEPEHAAEEGAAGSAGGEIVADEGGDAEEQPTLAVPAPDDLSDITETDPVEPDSREAKFRKNGPAFDVDMEKPMWPNQAELKPPLPRSEEHTSELQSR